MPSNKIDSKNFLKAISQLCEEKGLSEEYILDALEQGLVKAYKKNSGNENLKVEIDLKKGKIKMYAQKEVVQPEDFISAGYQITLDDAQNIKSSYKLGDIVNVEVKPYNLGRVAAQTAKQIIFERVRTAEKNNIFNEFNDKKGELISGIVQKVDEIFINVNLGKLEGILPGKSLVRYSDTNCFAMDRLEIRQEHRLCATGTFYCLYVLAGQGSIFIKGIEQPLQVNSQLFISAVCEDFTIIADTKNPLVILRFKGPELKANLLI